MRRICVMHMPSLDVDVDFELVPAGLESECAICSAPKCDRLLAAMMVQAGGRYESDNVSDAELVVNRDGTILKVHG